VLLRSLIRRSRRPWSCPPGQPAWLAAALARCPPALGAILAGQGACGSPRRFSLRRK